MTRRYTPADRLAARAADNDLYDWVVVYRCAQGKAPTRQLCEREIREAVPAMVKRGWHRRDIANLLGLHEGVVTLVLPTFDPWHAQVVAA